MNKISLLPQDSNSQTKKSILQLATKYIRKGEIVFFPTDTTYALGVDATSELAIKKVYNLKIRSPRKPMHVVVADMEMASEYVFLTEQALRIAEAFLPGPLTIILKHKGNIPATLVSNLPTLGIRLPRNNIALSLSKLSGVPITATSANLSGKNETYSAEEFLRQLADEELSFESGLIIDQGKLPLIHPSTIVDLSGNKPIIAREGPITKEQIFDVFQNTHFR